MYFLKIYPLNNFYRTPTFTDLWEVSIKHLRRVNYADSGRLLILAPGPVPFGICKWSFVETTDTQSYIRPPIHYPFPYLTPHRAWLLSLNWHHQLIKFYLIWLLIEFDITEYRFPWSICSVYGMLTGDAYSSGHLVPFHLGPAYVLLVETNPFP